MSQSAPEPQSVWSPPSCSPRSVGFSDIFKSTYCRVLCTSLSLSTFSRHKMPQDQACHSVWTFWQFLQLRPVQSNVQHIHIYCTKSVIAERVYQGPAIYVAFTASSQANQATVCGMQHPVAFSISLAVPVIVSTCQGLSCSLCLTQGQASQAPGFGCPMLHRSTHVVQVVPRCWRSCRSDH